MASINYGSPLSFLGTAFWDIDQHPGARSGPPSPTPTFMPTSWQCSGDMLHEPAAGNRRESRAMTDSWETIGVYPSPRASASTPAGLSPQEAPVPIYAVAAPPPSAGFFSALCRKLGEMFS